MFSRRRRPSPSTIERRLARLPDHEITTWAEVALTEVGRSLRGSEYALASAETQAEVLLAALRELRRRRGR